MAEINLRAYVEYIEDRLGRDAHTEVIAQCHHILETYPKYVEVYKLLARTLTEQEDYQDALDLFQRVLSADPSDFVAHVGMSDCYRASGSLEQAIWHLERAYEQVPSNVDIQDAIKDLYVEQGKTPPRKVQLTAASLARLYMNGKLYNQAILELKKGLAQDSERLDLQLLLADALWASHQPVDAGKVAAEVLKRLPNSIDANRILAQLWLQAGQPKEARPFLELLKVLDPYRAYEVEHKGKSAPVDTFRLFMLDYSTTQRAEDVGAADWVSQIQSIGKEKGVTGPLLPPQPGSASATPPAAPDWLQDVIGGQDQATPPAADTGAAPSSVDVDSLFAASSPTVPSEPTEPSAPSSGVPDWLADVLNQPSPDQPPAPPSGGAEAPDWLKDAIGELAAAPPPAPAPPPSAGAEPPDWLKDVIGTPPESPAPPAPSEPADREAPDWLNEILTGESAPQAEAAPPEPQEELPGVMSESWLDDLLASPTPPISGETLEPSEPAAGDVPPAPDWMAEVSPPPDQSAGFDTFDDLEPWDAAPEAPEDAAGSITPTPPSDADASEEQAGAAPDWLESAAAPAEPPEPPADESPAEEELPDWLESAAAPAEPPEPPADELPAEEELPDWLESAAAPAEPPEPPADELPAEEELPDWLESAAAPAEPPEPPADELPAEEELPDWLQATAESTEPPEPPAEELPAEEELPDWLQATAESTEPPEPPADELPAEEELPDWLQATAEFDGTA